MEGRGVREREGRVNISYEEIWMKGNDLDVSLFRAHNKEGC